MSNRIAPTETAGLIQEAEKRGAKDYLKKTSSITMDLVHLEKKAMEILSNVV